MRRLAVPFLLCGCLSARLAAQQPAPSITVVANPSFRPTGVLLPHFQFFVTVDTAAGGLVLRDLTINPVTFTGTMRIEGVPAGARAPEDAGFADSVRFGGDGQVTLLVADAGSRSPIAIEPRGARTASGGRLAITARSWPFGRGFVVSIEPADLYEHYWRTAGYGVRDRIRIDDRRGLAFLTDTSVAGTVVAMGLGRGTRGTLRTDLTSVVLFRRFGEEVGRERRAVGKLVLVIDPRRDSAGTARAEIVFGVGSTDDEAAQAALAASTEGDEPRFQASPRVRTPSGDLDLALEHLFAAARPMLDWYRLGGYRAVPSGSDGFLGARVSDGWRAGGIALQLGDAGSGCGQYQLFGRYAALTGAIAGRVDRRGRYLWVDSSTVPSNGEGAAWRLLTGYSCYRATRDSVWLVMELPGLRAIAPTAREAASEGSELLAEALERLAELEDEAAGRWRLPGGENAGVWRSEAARLRSSVPAEAAGPGWRALVEEAGRTIRTQYGRPSGRADTNGLSMAAAGGLLDRVARGLFGVDEHLDRVEVGPRVDGIADEFVWRLDGWRLGSDSLSVRYRPADHAATIRVGALHRVRLALRFPWLSAQSCVSLQRGFDAIEHPQLVPLSDGAMFVDLRAHFDPAEVTVSAAPCVEGR